MHRIQSPVACPTEVYLCLGEEKLIEELGSILGTGDGMTDRPLVLVNLVIVSTHVSLTRQPKLRRND